MINPTDTGPSPRASSSNDRRALLLLFLATIAIVAILPYIPLTALSKWQLDEYGTSYQLRTGGFDMLLQRVWSWSFRPASELLIYGYVELVENFGRQFMTPAILFVWGLFLAGAFIPALAGRQEPSGPSRLSLAIVSGAVVALILGSRSIGEVFYWPMGSFAYVPTLAAIAYFTLRASFGTRLSSSLRWPDAVALVVAAWSSEVGAMFVLGFGLSILPLQLLTGAGREARGLTWRTILIVAPPLAAALCVAVFLALGRIGANAENFGSDTTHALWPSVWAALGTLPLELIGYQPRIARGEWSLFAVIPKALLFVGAYALFSTYDRVRDRPKVAELSAIVLAFLGAICVSSFAGYYQFGVSCCERHGTMRESFVVLALVAGARLLSLATSQSVRRLSLRARGHAMAGLAGITAAALFATSMNAQRLASDYTKFNSALEARAATWSQGRSPGTAMVFYQPPVLDVVGGQEWPLGAHQRAPETNWIIVYIMNYFGKDQIEMRPAGKDF